MQHEIKPSGRILGGVAGILLLIIVWSVLVATGATWIEPLPWPVHLIYYLAAGLLWIVPMKPLVRWMQSGRDA